MSQDIHFVTMYQVVRTEGCKGRRVFRDTQVLDYYADEQEAANRAQKENCDLVEWNKDRSGTIWRCEVKKVFGIQCAGMTFPLMEHVMLR